MEKITEEVEETAGPSAEFLQASVEMEPMGDGETEYQIYFAIEEEEEEDPRIWTRLDDEEDPRIQIYRLDSAAAEEEEEEEESSRLRINLPAISSRTEEEMMKVARSEKKKKKVGEDKSIETLAKKLLEKLEEDKGDFEIDEIAEEEDEDPKRIYDLMNIFEGLGLLSKKEAKTYSRESHGKMEQTLEKLQKMAVEVDLKTQIWNALKKPRVLQFSQNKENEDEEVGKTKEFHMKQLTEKIMMIFLSSELDTLSYQQILGLVFKEDMRASEDSVKLKIVRVLKTLVGVEILSGSEVKEQRGKKVLYQLRLNLGSNEDVQGEQNPTNDHDLLAVAMDLSLHQGEMEPVDLKPEVCLVDVTNLSSGESKQEDQLLVEMETREMEVD